jgi:anti-sigma factor RsiW
VTPEQARELFSAAYDAQLDAAERRAFQEVLERDPGLASEYVAFCATLDAVGGEREQGEATPDVLKAVQKRLRNASGGRYYSDRFAERSGVGRLSPFALLILLMLLLALLWFGFAALTQLRPAA